MRKPKPPSDEMYERLEAETGYPVGAIQHALNALNAALHDRSLTRRGQTDAAGVCRCFLELAIDIFAENAEDVMREWGTTRSQNVGHMIYGLIDAGLARAGDEDQREDFTGLFDLDRDQSTWELKW